MNRVLITQRMTRDKYGEYIDYLENSYINFFSRFNITPILLPNNIKNPVEYLLDLRCNKVILTGGDDIQEISKKNKRNKEFKRDLNEKKLIKYSIKNKIPVFCICRGFQLMNVVLGGQITKNISTGIEKNQKIIITDPSENVDTIIVNSYHNHGIKLKQLSRHLIAKGLSINGEYVEYFIHKSLPIIGIQWHPERKIKSRKFNMSLFNTFLKMK